MRNFLWRKFGRPVAFRVIAAGYEASLFDSWTFHELIGALDKIREQSGYYQEFQKSKAMRKK